MYGTRAFELIKELKRTIHTDLPPFDVTAVRLVFEEMELLTEQNQQDTTLSTLEGNDSVIPGPHLRHAALERNQRCVLAYVHNRLMKIRDYRWTSGTILPESTRVNATEQEEQFFQNYNKLLSNYMRDIGDVTSGLDLTENMFPPGKAMARVLALKDWELELENGESVSVMIKKNSISCLPRSQCEELVRQNIVEYVTMQCH